VNKASKWVAYRDVVIVKSPKEISLSIGIGFRIGLISDSIRPEIRNFIGLDRIH